VVGYLSYEASFGVDKEIEESGYITTWPLYVVFFTANKANSLVTFVLGIPFERLIFWHQLWSILAVVTGFFHFFCAYELGGDDRRMLLVEDAALPEEIRAGSATTTTEERMLSGDDGAPTIHDRYGLDPNIAKFAFETDTNITGSILLISLLLLVLPSVLSIFRRLFFDVWYMFHVVLALVAGVFVIIHGTENILIALVWWIIDLSTRYLLMTGCLYPREASLRALPGEIVEISFPKTKALEYDPGQFLMIAIPKIGFSQFHPFSISSSPHQNTITLHTKALGGWTRKLMELAKTEPKVNILMEGPYGKLAVDINDTDRYKTVVLIAGGIGITPLMSVANYLLQQVKNGREMTKIRFVWTIRSLDILQGMKDSVDVEQTSGPSKFVDDVQDNAQVNSPGPSLFDDRQSVDALQFDVYVTGKTGSTSTVGDISTVMGRPDIDQILKETKELAAKEGEGSVAVLVCGPTGMIDMCRDASRRMSDACCGGVKFEFHEETFEL
jgi:Predicted ferric reductase